jgi:UDP-N-acetylmuramoylalanine--D-glutamate ligase
MAFSVTGKRVVVVGGERSGVAAALLLADRGAHVVVTDVKDAIAGRQRLAARGIALELGGHRQETLREAELLVLSPGVAWKQPQVEVARRAGVPVIGELELAWRWLRGRVIAITGTKGKSTTTTLVGRMLRASGLDAPHGGNIGVPLSEQVGASTPETVHVVEVSSFQLEGIDTFRPWIAAMTNFSPDHLDRHGSVEAYAAAKARIFVNQGPEDWVVLNADDEASGRLASQARSRRLTFGLDVPIRDGITVSGDWIVRRDAGQATPLVPLAEVAVVGRHLLADVLAACAMASLVGVRGAAMSEAVSGFTGLEHAMELVGEIDGVRFVNDSKATNMVSARRSIESITGRVVPIVGGRYKGGDFRDLRGPLEARARLVVAIGESAPLVRAALESLVEVREASSMREAVRAAFDAAGPGATVLLAPACSSFDMFADYAERGRVFKHEVAALAEEVGQRSEG